MVQSTRELTIAAANQLSEVARVIELLDSLWDDTHLGEDLRADLNIAVEEMLSNAIRHGQVPDDESITVRAAALPDAIEIEIQDPGRPFNPLEHPMPDPKAPLAERRGGGLGIFMVVNMMDQVHYERADGKNRIRMIRKLA